MNSLRAYQTKAFDEVRSEFRKGHRRILVVAPTGSGKTVIAAAIIKSAVSKGTKVLFLAHRRELIAQASRKMDDAEIDHGIVMANHPRHRPELPVQVASVQTLIRRIDRGQPDYGLVIVDEAHRSMAETYRKILSRFPKAFIIGLTATPLRGDGQGLGDLFQSIVEVSSVSELTELGFLVPVKTFAPTSPDLAKLRIVRGDFDEREAAQAMDKPSLIGDIVGHWNRLAKGRQTVCFAAGIAHSKHIRDSFLEVGIKAEHLSGSTPEAERDAILNRLSTGETTIVCNCAVLTEGWDCPAVGCCILARPTTSVGLYLQMAGRILRPHIGKIDAIILDHAGCAHRHGLPADEREWSLAGGRNQPGKDYVPQSRICPECRLAFGLVAVCPGCGWMPVKKAKPKVITHVEGQLSEVMGKSRSRASRDMSDLHRVAREKGYRPGWAFHQMRKKWNLPAKA